MARNALLFDVDCLFQLPGHRIKDQDLIVIRHHRIPGVATCKRRGLCAIGQGDAVGHFGASAIETGDKQADHDYKPANHHNGQYRDQLAQKAQVGWFNRFRSVVHGYGSHIVSDRGSPACAP